MSTKNQWKIAMDDHLSSWFLTTDCFQSPHEAIEELIRLEVNASMCDKISPEAARISENLKEARSRVLQLEIARYELASLLTSAADLIKAIGENGTEGREKDILFVAEMLYAKAGKEY